VRALLPAAATDVDLVEAYAIPAGAGQDHPFVRCNMISSLDGAVTLEGRSAMLGGPADARVFATLRSVTDVILVGAGTVRAEDYGPARLDEQARAERRSRGQAEVPPIAVVTRSGNLDWSSPFFTEAEARPIVLTANGGDDGALQRARQVADVLIAGDQRVEPALALEQLRRAGHRSVLLEGGPGLNADVVHTGQLDELCLTLAPRVVAGSGPRVLAGPELDRPLDLETVHVLEEDGFLFLRLAVPASPAG
jgi:riboflavin biosynthesis pyrimidine reductase